MLSQFVVQHLAGTSHARGHDGQAVLPNGRAQVATVHTQTDRRTDTHQSALSAGFFSMVATTLPPWKGGLDHMARTSRLIWLWTGLQASG